MLPEYETIQSTILQGGWYRVDVTEDLAILSLATLEFNDRE